MDESEYSQHGYATSRKKSKNKFPLTDERMNDGLEFATNESSTENISSFRGNKSTTKAITSRRLKKKTEL